MAIARRARIDDPVKRCDEPRGREVCRRLVLDKGDRDNLSQAERSELRQIVQTYEVEYRKGVDAKVAEMREGA